MEALNHPLLAPHKDQILATAKPTAEITLTRQDEGLTLWQSKVGGDPYLPKGADYPRHPAGHALTLLAQINFAEVPKLPDFPEKGILQFFIDGTDDMYGADCGGLLVQDGFRIVYYADVSENIDDLVRDFSPYAVENKVDVLPFGGQYAMAFALREQLVPMEDFHFDAMTAWEWSEEVQAVYDLYSQDASGIGHRIGGYPWFMQGDPRQYDEDLQDYVLLFQLDSDWGEESGNNIMWGDAGVGNFFIRPDDLKKLDFSKVMYTWDCG